MLELLTIHMEEVLEDVQELTLFTTTELPQLDRNTALLLEELNSTLSI